MFPLLLLSPSYGRHYRRSIGTASPIHLISQPSRLPIFGLYIESQACNPLFSPLPLSPRLSTGVLTYSTKHLLTPNVFYFPLLLLYATGILEDEAGVCDEHGMPKVMIAGRECARFDAVVLNAYKECHALDQEDRRHYLRRR